jgi:hypothetical protein
LRTVEANVKYLFDLPEKFDRASMLSSISTFTSTSTSTSTSASFAYNETEDALVTEAQREQALKFKNVVKPWLENICGEHISIWCFPDRISPTDFSFDLTAFVLSTREQILLWNMAVFRKLTNDVDLKLTGLTKDNKTLVRDAIGTLFRTFKEATNRCWGASYYNTIPKVLIRLLYNCALLPPHQTGSKKSS